MINSFQDQKGIQNNLSAIHFSAENLMKSTFFKNLEQKVIKRKEHLLLGHNIKTIAINFETSSVEEGIVIRSLVITFFSLLIINFLNFST